MALDRVLLGRILLRLLLLLFPVFLVFSEGVAGDWWFTPHRVERIADELSIPETSSQ